MINVLLSCDDHYAPHVGVVILSILHNTSAPQAIMFYLVDNCISSANRQRLQELVDSREAAIEFVDPTEEGFELAAQSRYGLAACQRMDMGRLLPDSVSKVIYLDADVVVLGDLSELWDQSLDGYPVGAVENLSPKPCQSLGWKRCGYFNSGMLVVDLTAWRSEDVKSQCLHYMSAQSEGAKLPDQNALNHVFSGKWKKLDLKWNLQADVHGVLKKYFQGCGYSHDELESARAAPAVIHFIGKQKPWLLDCHNAYKAFFDYYKALSPWATEPPVDYSFMNMLKSRLSLKKLARKHFRYKQLAIQVSDLVGNGH